ncbi:hypothetical protein RRG08_034400 [Elysia crispata]|uniref:Uncharacterized protein n=1 Tax=Elysia crispata TaxID=231223 RepID=A0AAE0YD45_9GAST|nr:hypothetical protein RRG08_034400 [Elysia crispata]
MTCTNVVLKTPFVVKATSRGNLRDINRADRGGTHREPPPAEAPISSCSFCMSHSEKLKARVLQGGCWFGTVAAPPTSFLLCFCRGFVDLVALSGILRGEFWSIY